MKDFIRSIIRKFGYDINYFGRFKILRHLAVDVVLDVGANQGQYGKSLRRGGYRGKIISFEPLNSAFSQLKSCSKNDSSWQINNHALGDENTTSVINISSNSYSSSILDMTDAHMDLEEESAYVGEQAIVVKTLDSVFENIIESDNKVFLKIDTQGYEKKVLLGAFNSLENIIGIQLEVSLIELYKEEDLFLDMINFLDSKGFKTISIETGFFDPKTGFLLQSDLIFVKKL
jgi:FkbM family methyltransferase